MRFRFTRAFTLIELAIVLVVVSLMTGFGMKAMQSTTTTNCYDQTRIQLRDISTAIQTYVRNNSKYPLPAKINVGVTDPTYGQASATGIDTNADATVDANTVYIGALPYATLGMAPSYAADCWGNKFTYMVSKLLTVANSAGPGSSTAGNLIVKTGTTASPSTITSTAAYAVISHGDGALGACSRSYTGGKSNCNCNASQSDPTLKREDKENCDINNAVVFSTTFNNGAAATDFFDDLIVYQDKAATVSSNCLPTDKVWGAGNHCSAPIGQVTSGTVTNLTNSNVGYTGSATYTCTNGTQTISPGSLCAASGCSAQALAWNDGVTAGMGASDCGVMMPFQSAGTTQTYSSTTSNFTGSITMKCSASDVLTIQSQSCTPTCPSSASSTIKWGNNNTNPKNCQLTTAISSQSAGTSSVLTNTASGYYGTVTYACTANATNDTASWATTTPATCVSGCAPGSNSWGTSNHCTATYGALANGGSVAANNTASGYSGSETVTCTTGVIGYSAQTCGADCTSGSSTWNTNCSGPYPALKGDGSDSPYTVNNTNSSYGGTETATCTDGSLAFGSKTCAINGVCGAKNGADLAAAPSTGLCTSGAASAVAGSGPWTWTCGAAPGSVANCTAYKTCAAGTQTWSSNCSASVTLANHAATQALTNTASGYSGSATATCNAGGTGAWSTSGSCSAAGCSATTTTWSGLSAGCGGSVPVIADGNAVSVPNTASGYNGYVTASCTGTTLSYSAAACAAACPAQVQLWQNGALGTGPCSASLPATTSYRQQWWIASGASGTTGQATLECYNGTIMNYATGSDLQCNFSGACGTANGTAVASKPTSAPALCSMGTSAGAVGTGPWTWTCRGGGTGTDASCSANKSCAAKAFTWNTNCSGSSTLGNPGDVQTVNNTASGYSGLETVTCDAGGGGLWSAGAPKSCAVVSCPSQVVATGDPDHCDNATMPASANGAACTIHGQYSSGIYTTNYTCSSGTWIEGTTNLGSCFLGDVTVTLADGSKVPMTQLKVGDRVRGKTRINTVLRIPSRSTSETLYGFNGGKAFVTGGHPFWTTDGWKAVDPSLTPKELHNVRTTKLAAGDELWLDNGQRMRLSSITPYDAGEHRVYSPIMTGDHTYFADGFLVHNKSFTCSTPTVTCP